jgi:hypothetical protein
VIVCCVAIFRSNNCDAFFLVFCPFYWPWYSKESGKEEAVSG